MGGGRAYTGESSKDKAANKMDKFMARSRGSYAQNESIEAQLKRIYGSNWRTVRDEMIREADPEYKAKKDAAIADFHKRFYTEVPPYMRGTEVKEDEWVAKRMTQWIADNAGTGTND